VHRVGCYTHNYIIYTNVMSKDSFNLVLTSKVVTRDFATRWPDDETSCDSVNKSLNYNKITILFTAPFPLLLLYST
jgi:hypothetical protein